MVLMLKKWNFIGFVREFDGISMVILFKMMGFEALMGSHRDDLNIQKWKRPSSIPSRCIKIAESSGTGSSSQLLLTYMSNPS